MTEWAGILQHWPAWAGSAPGWIMAFAFLGILWKGLPAVLDAWSNSVAKERAHREREIKRLEDQITASDKRHEECMDGQRKLREEMGQMAKDHADEVGRLQNLISGLIIQMRQMQLSSTDSAAITPPLPSEFAAMLIKLEQRKDS